MNPDWMPRIDLVACIGCGECVSLCPTQALGRVADKAALIHPDVCTYCAACEDVCPENAIELPYQIVLASNQEDIRDEHK
jgi:ferredoxin